jgi:hypothetical protein
MVRQHECIKKTRWNIRAKELMLDLANGKDVRREMQRLDEEASSDSLSDYQQVSAKVRKRDCDLNEASSSDKKHNGNQNSLWGIAKQGFRGVAQAIVKRTEWLLKEDARSETSINNLSFIKTYSFGMTAFFCLSRSLNDKSYRLQSNERNDMEMELATKENNKTIRHQKRGPRTHHDTNPFTPPYPIRR